MRRTIVARQLESHWSTRLRCFSTMHWQPPTDEREPAQTSSVEGDGSLATGMVTDFDDDSFNSPELQAVQRLLASFERESPNYFAFPASLGDEPEQRAVSTHAGLNGLALQPPPASPSIESRGGFLAWLFLGAGLMAFTCGGVMLAWSIVQKREELWAIGMPLALGGQGAIIFGLLGLLESAAQRTSSVINALDEYRGRLALLHDLAATQPNVPGTHRRAA